MKAEASRESGLALHQQTPSSFEEFRPEISSKYEGFEMGFIRLIECGLDVDYRLIDINDRSNKDNLTRLLVIMGACAGLCCNALYYFPILIVISGVACVTWDCWLQQKVKKLGARLRWRKAGNIPDAEIDAKAASRPSSARFLWFVRLFVAGVIVVGVQPPWRILRTKAVMVSAQRGINATPVGLVFTAVYRLWQIGYRTAQNNQGQSLALDPLCVVVTTLAYVETAWFKVPPTVVIVFGGVLGLCWYRAVGG